MSDILIVGSGALAMYFGARLTAVDVDVTLLGTWQEGISALQNKGIILVENGEETRFPVKAISAISDVENILAALVLVKSWQTERAAQQLSTVLHPEGIALTLQNGLGNLELLTNTLGKERAALGVTTIGATVVGPGKVRRGGKGKITLSQNPRLTVIADLLKKAGILIEEVSDISSVIWGKLVINAAINPLTALLGVKNGQLLESSAARELMAAAAREAALVAEAKGIHLNYQDPTNIVEGVAQRTADNISSMLQDIKRGAPTENEWISGAIVREAQKTGLSVPTNQLLYMLIRSKVELLLG